MTMQNRKFHFFIHRSEVTQNAVVG